MQSVLERLRLTVPIVLAPMAGGVGTPALVAAVSQAGGLGSVGAAYLTPEQITTQGQAVRAQTDRPFAVNLFAPLPVPTVSAEQVAAACAELAPFHASLGLPAPSLPEQVQEDLEAQFAAVVALRAAVCSFAFGRLSPAQLAQLHGAGILAVGTATSVTEARVLEADGVDAVVMQGGAAGGHRGGWQEDTLADTVALTRAVVQVVRIPVIAAGGLMSAADVRAVLDAGAALAQCGTAFLLADEAGTSATYRAALTAGGETVLTTAFSGRSARGLANAVSREVHAPLPYPHQNALTRPLRTAGAAAGRADVLSLWAGTGYAQATTGPAVSILARLTP